MHIRSLLNFFSSVRLEFKGVRFILGLRTPNLESVLHILSIMTLLRCSNSHLDNGCIVELIDMKSASLALHCPRKNNPVLCQLNNMNHHEAPLNRNSSKIRANEFVHYIYCWALFLQNWDRAWNMDTKPIGCPGEGKQPLNICGR